MGLYRNTTWIALFTAVALSGPIHSQTGRPLTPEELMHEERVRSAVESALEQSSLVLDSGYGQVNNFVRSAFDLEEFGDDVVPYLVNELDQTHPDTFFFSAFALGNLGTPEAGEALRRAIERADAERGDFALMRKAWAAYGLGMVGEVDAVDLMNDGKLQAGHYPMHAGTTALEATALQVSLDPDCVPRLTAQLERFKENPKQALERRFVVHSLRRIADPRSIPALIALREDPSDTIRGAAARALGAIRTPAAVAGLMSFLDDESTRVRRRVVLQLEQILPPDQLPTIVAKLETEEDPWVRGSLYKIAARLGGKELLGDLRGYWRPEIDIEAEHLLDALGIAGGNDALDLVTGASRGQGRVAVQAIKVLVEIDTPESKEAAIASIGSENWTTVQTAVETLSSLRMAAAGPAIVDRLVGNELAATIHDVHVRDHVRILFEGLDRLRFADRIEEIDAAMKKQRDPTLIAMWEKHRQPLALVHENGKSIKRWLAVVDSDDPQDRIAAYDALGRIGSSKAVPPLVRRFGRVEPKEGAEILRALASLDHEESRALMRRVLESPEFDAVARLRLRNMAAWAAYRLGGDDMSAALESSVRRRKGQDAKVLVYLMVLDREQALPIFEEYRIVRMRYLKWTRGNEQETLHGIAKDIGVGRSLESFERPPDQISFR